MILLEAVEGSRAAEIGGRVTSLRALPVMAFNYMSAKHGLMLIPGGSK